MTKKKQIPGAVAKAAALRSPVGFVPYVHSPDASLAGAIVFDPETAIFVRREEMATLNANPDFPYDLTREIGWIDEGAKSGHFTHSPHTRFIACPIGGTVEVFRQHLNLGSKQTCLAHLEATGGQSSSNNGEKTMSIDSNTQLVGVKFGDLTLTDDELTRIAHRSPLFRGCVHEMTSEILKSNELKAALLYWMAEAYDTGLIPTEVSFHGYTL